MDYSDVLRQARITAHMGGHGCDVQPHILPDMGGVCSASCRYKSLLRSLLWLVALGMRGLLGISKRMRT
jgi:hypothetical protein